MNILFPYMARWRSANWTRYHQLLTALCRKGHQVFILEPPALTSSEETNYTDLDIKLPEGMVVHEIRVPLWEIRLPLEKLAKKGLATLATKHVLQDFIKEHAIDVLLLYNFPQYVLARGISCLTVFDIADDLMAMFGHEVGQAWRPILHWIAKRLYHRLIQTSHLVVTTPSMVLAEELNDQVKVLPNGADWETAQRADGRQIREKYGTPIVGFVGSFEYFVDFDLVLLAAEAFKEASFLLVGTGRCWQTIKTQIEERSLANVFLVGPVPYPRGLDYIAAMDVCLIPFRKGLVSDRACPLKLFEYAALSKPIVSTSISGVMEIGKDFVMLADTATEFIEAIGRVLHRPDSVRHLAIRGSKLVRSTYRWDIISDQFLELLDGVGRSPSDREC